MSTIILPCYTNFATCSKDDIKLYESGVNYVWLNMYSGILCYINGGKNQ